MDKETERTKEEVLELVDGAGVLEFKGWYKNALSYSNGEYLVEIVPKYRDNLCPTESLKDLLSCEDYQHVMVYKGTSKPWAWSWYKQGNM